MWVISIIAAVSMVLFAIVGFNQRGGEDHIEAQTVAEVNLYRTFVSSADMVFNAQPAPASRKVYYWTDLVSSGFTPPSARNAVMRTDWYAVRLADGTWAACTSLSENALTRAGELFPPPTEGLINKRVSNVVALSGTNEEATQYAPYCQ